MAERMNFVSRRGRTAEYQRNEWLKSLRAERKKKSGTPYTIFCPIGWMNFRGTFRRAKFEALRLANENSGLRVWLVDNITNIQVWDSYTFELK